MRVDPLYSVGLSNSLGTLKNTQNELTSQLSTGVRVNTPSDDPLAASESVKLGSTIARDDAYNQASTTIESRLRVADSALGSVVTQITSAVSLAVQGTNGTLNAADLSALGQQMAGIRDEVVSLANTSYAGTYLFAGTSNAKPYVMNTGVSPAAATYQGDTHQQVTVTNSGQKLVTGLVGSDLFSASGSDVLKSLNALVADFSSGTVSASSVSDLNELRNGLSTVSMQRSVLSASVNSLQETVTYASNESSQMQASQTALVSSDMAQVATLLGKNETQQQALMDVMSATAKLNLFQYMQG